MKQEQRNEVGEAGQRKPPPQMAFILFVDLVGFSKLKTYEQLRRIELLEKHVYLCPQIDIEQQGKSHLFIPSGDGFAIVLLERPDLLLETTRALAKRIAGTKLSCRMGIHQGLVLLRTDPSGHRNLVGGGINMAQRVMDFGDAGHILASTEIQRSLSELKQEYERLFHSIGVFRTKHNEPIAVFNVYGPQWGNRDIPSRRSVDKSNGRVSLGPIEQESSSRGRKDSEKVFEIHDMVSVPAGHFFMGSPAGEGEKDEHPQHRVYVDAFYIARQETTVRQFRDFCSETGYKMPKQPDYSRDDHPVVNIHWNDAIAYCRWAGVRLPTEAEWEKACRAGSTKRYFFGNSKNALHKFGWYDANSGEKTHPVGQKKANQLGLHDIMGNVWEWCSDWYASNYYRISPERNPCGPASGEAHVLRGGGWEESEYYCRSAARYYEDPVFQFVSIGFRTAFTVPKNGRGSLSRGQKL